MKARPKERVLERLDALRAYAENLPDGICEAFLPTLDSLETILKSAATASSVLKTGKIEFRVDGLLTHLLKRVRR